MTGPYDDIIHLPHHVSKTRRRMSAADRAAQFSPFAALTGHDAAIRETARLTDAPIFLADDGRALLDERIRLLKDHQQEHPEVTVTYFVPDERKQGGAYVTVTGNVHAVRPRLQDIVLEDGTEVDFDRIYRLECGLFREDF